MQIKSEVRFAVTKKDGVITEISRGYIYQPKVNFSGGTVKWYDDTSLIKKKEARNE